MQDYTADLHIHIGRTKKGRVVKITASDTLTLENILHYASTHKGLGVIGIIDCHSPEVLEELRDCVKEQKMIALPKGGLRYGETTLIMGAELEIYDEHCQGPIHILAFLPTLEAMQHFSDWLRDYVTNIHLSSQRVYCEAKELQRKVAELHGLFIPAHIFTPFKSLFGKGVKHDLTEVLDPALIDGVELGLSSDTMMVSKMEQLFPYTFLSNSDAHSLAKIAREYQMIRMEEANFEELRLALHEQDGRAVVANYGLQPVLGKYYETICHNCGQSVQQDVVSCPHCDSRQMIRGVAMRIQQLSSEDVTPRQRPPYVHQVPLEFIPGLGPKTLAKLVEAFGTEMAILHEATLDQLATVVAPVLAQKIVDARTGQLSFTVGGGGVYGKVKKD